MTPDQAAEIAKYKRAYTREGYRMGDARRSQAETLLSRIALDHGITSYLDVGCGRGEMLRYAREIGAQVWKGVEVLPELLGEHVYYGTAWSIPVVDHSFEIVSMLDVIEHLLPGDDERACKELARVASDYIIITASNVPSMNGSDDLHINKRPYDEWDRLFREWFGTGWGVKWLQNQATQINQIWLVSRVTD